MARKRACREGRTAPRHACMRVLHDVAETFSVRDDARIVPTHIQNDGTLPFARAGMTARLHGIVQKTSGRQIAAPTVSIPDRGNVRHSYAFPLRGRWPSEARSDEVRLSHALSFRRSELGGVPPHQSCIRMTAVSPAGSVGASAFGRGVHRTPAPPVWPICSVQGYGLLRCARNAIRW